MSSEPMNEALILIKPHASQSAAFCSFVETRLDGAGLAILTKGVQSGPNLTAVVDAHYGALARRALHDAPGSWVPEIVDEGALEKFKAAFGGKELKQALAEGSLVNAAEGVRRLDSNRTNYKADAAEFARVWRSQGPSVKLAPGTYVAQVDSLIVVNGFYIAMREGFCAAEAETRYMKVQWRESSLSWRAFRSELVGSTDPSKAHADSIRGKLAQGWSTEFALAQEPTTTLNGVHASASALEGEKELRLWLSAPPGELSAYSATRGVPEAALEKWLSNAEVAIAGVKKPAFDHVEDLGVEAVTDVILASETGGGETQAKRQAAGKSPACCASM